MARQTVRRPPAQHTGRTQWPDKLSDASSTAHWPDAMARQTVRRPPAQHTGRTQWPDKLSGALPHSTLAGWNGQAN
eukprot:3672255-Rhodomonas_salina.1